MCQCSLCGKSALDRAVSDKRLSMIRFLQESLLDQVRYDRKHLMLVEMLLALASAEELEIRYTWYKIAAYHYSARGDRRSTMMYAMKALEALRSHERTNPLIVRDLEGLLEFPSQHYSWLSVAKRT
jgi:hypothetical protein